MVTQHNPYLFIFKPHFPGQNLTPNPVNYNNAMSQTSVSVEWLFNEIKTYFQFVFLKSQMWIGLRAADKIYTVYVPYFKMQEHVYAGIKFLSFSSSFA